MHVAWGCSSSFDMLRDYFLSWINRLLGQRCLTIELIFPVPFYRGGTTRLVRIVAFASSISWKSRLLLEDYLAQDRKRRVTI